jgi:hypothetical protein
MIRWLGVQACAAVWCASSVFGATARESDAFDTIVRPFLAENCFFCHGEQRQKAGIAFTDYPTEARALADRELWGLVREQLSKGEMPPEERPRPSKADVDAVIAWIDATSAGSVSSPSEANGKHADASAKRAIDPGRVTLRRLNRTQYENTIRDLVGVDYESARELPSDDVGYGFDDIGDVLSMPDILMEKYLAAAERISAAAVIIEDPEHPPSAHFDASKLDGTKGSVLRGDRQVLFTVSEVGASFSFARDGEYLLRVEAYGDQAGPDPARVSLRIDGRELARIDVKATSASPQRYEARVRAAAGMRRVAAGFVNDYYNKEDPDPKNRDRNLIVISMDVAGPLDAPVLSAFQRKYLAGEGALALAGVSRAGEHAPPAPLQTRKQEIGAQEQQREANARAIENTVAATQPPLAGGDGVRGHDGASATDSGRVAADRTSLESVKRRVVADVALHAYRRPPTDGEVERLIRLTPADAPLADCARTALKALLVSPHFLFRVELDPDARVPSSPLSANGASIAIDRSAADVHAISDWELAARLSYFLWSSMPDDELFMRAGNGTLHEPRVLDEEVARMLRDPRSSALSRDFASQWLQVRNLDHASPDPTLFPAFDAELRAAMKAETEMFFEAVLRENRSVWTLVDSDFTFVNERLARHYGIPGVHGSEMRRVRLQGGPRGGVLAQASVLTETSNPTRTSPVKRGKWILETLIDKPTPPPPPGVGVLDESHAASTAASLRERLAAHRANPDCAVCHARLDPLGFGLENFDATGAWRESDGAFAIDASGELAGGRTFRGPNELKQILSSDDSFVRCLAKKLATYALGRGLTAADEPAIDGLMRGLMHSLARKEPTLADVVLAVVELDAFRMRRAERTGS